MIPPELEAKILRLYKTESWKIGQIAREAGVHHSVVRRVVSSNGVSEGLHFVRPSMVDPYVSLIIETLKKHPLLPASRLYDMVRSRGYRGGPDHFRHAVAYYRPKPAGEAFLRLQVLPGEQAQVDWGHFGTLRVGRAERRLAAFVLVLSWSRAIYVRFFLDQRLENFMRGHQAAFTALGFDARENGPTCASQNGPTCEDIAGRRFHRGLTPAGTVLTWRCAHYVSEHRHWPGATARRASVSR